VLLPLIITFCLCAVFCITPLALYLTWLGSINKRSRTTVIGGGWDFVLTTTGLSGFILFGGGVLISALQSNLRYAARGNWEQLQQAWGEERLVWGMLAFGYLLIVCGAVLWNVLARSWTLAVYNVGREPVELAIDEVLASVGVPASRFGNVWANDRQLVQLDYFHAFRHASVRVLTNDQRLAEELDRGLRKRLADVPPADGQAAGWLLSASVTCLVTVLCSILLLAYFLYLVS